LEVTQTNLGRGLIKSLNHMKSKSSKVLAVIIARGGSKSLPRKNILSAGGRPLIAWTIEASLKSKSIDHVVLSSDDNEIIRVAKDWGCPETFCRPSYLADDTASSIDVVLHTLDQISGFDYVILLQPTSPLRSAVDIDMAFTHLLSNDAPCCVSICEVDQSPYWMYSVNSDNKIQAILPQSVSPSRRQDLPKTYVLNGAIYIAKIDWLQKNKSFITEDTIGFAMAKQNSLDIDTAEDFEIFRNRIEG
jgi:CMP-N,N'-diacetyllegionaminic acid synthase